jgi:hypothetical protein
MNKFLATAVLLSAAASASSVLAAAGVSHTFNNVAINTTTSSWASAGGNLITAGPSAPAGNWVTARVSFDKNAGSSGNITQTFFALGSAAATGNSLTPGFPAGTTIYYNASGQNTTTTPNLQGKWFNSALSTTYAGGSNPLQLSMRNAAGGVTNYTNVSVTLYQRATPAATGTLTTSDPTFVRPASFQGVGTPSAGFSTDRYDVVPFYVDTSGSYLLSLITASGGNGSIYINSFDPLAPTANLVRSASNFFGSSVTPSVGGVVRNPLTGSGFDATTSGIPGLALTAGTQYFFIPSATATNNNWELFSEGPNNSSINVGIVPEPTGLAAVGVLALAAARRRRA